MENYVNVKSVKTFQFYVSTWKENSVNRESSGQPEIGIKHIINPETELMLGLFLSRFEETCLNCLWNVLFISGP